MEVQQAAEKPFRHSRTSIPVCLGQEQNTHPGCSKRPSRKAAASEEARRTLRYVEPVSDARTPLADFFSILLVLILYERLDVD
jgi:hypothetical protein